MTIRGKLVSPQDMSSPLQEQTLSDAALLREALGFDREESRDGNSHSATLVALSGLPGTGKSHFARELTKRLTFLVLESDRIRKLLVSKPSYTPEEHSRVFAVCHLLIEAYLSQGRRVLFDATNLTEAFRRPLSIICHRLSVPLLLVRVTAPEDTVRARLSERATGMYKDDFSDAGWSIYCRLAPYEEPIEGPHFTVDSSCNISNVLNEIVLSVAGTG